MLLFVNLSLSITMEAILEVVASIMATVVVLSLVIIANITTLEPAVVNIAFPAEHLESDLELRHM